MENDDEVLELKQGLTIFATAKAENDSLHKIVINSLDNESPILLINEKEVCMAA